MVDVPIVIGAIGGLVFLAHFFSWIFSYTSIPDGLLLMALGWLAAFFGLISPEFFGETGNIALSIALVVILFQSGTKLDVATLKSALGGTVVLTITSFVAVMAIIGTILWLVLGLNPLVAFMISAAIGGTSSAIVIPFLDKITIGETPEAVLVLESAFSDVLAIVITIALLNVYQAQTFDPMIILTHLLASFGYAGIVGIVAGAIWSLMLDQVRHLDNSLFVTIAVVFILYAGIEWLGFSGPMTALAFGITLGNAGAMSRYLHQNHPLLRWLIRPYSLSRREKSFFSEMVFLLQTFFFVYIGLSITFANTATVITALALTFILLGLRLFIVRITIAPQQHAFASSLTAILIPKGLASAVLISLLVQEQVPNATYAQDLVYSLILWSIIITSFMVFLISRTGLGNLYQMLLTPTYARAPRGRNYPL